MLTLFQKLVLYFVHNNRKKPEQQLDFSKFSRIGILYQKPEQEAAVLSFVEKLKLLKKETSLLALDEGSKAAEAVKLPQVLTQKDLLFSFPKNASLQPFLSRSFDLIINLGKDNCFPLLYVAATADAPVKVGPYHPELMPYYDLMFDVKPQDGIAAFIAQFNQFFKC
ncbi:MAG: hypothetical protein WD077_06395 [Bacteroidia bacterium]